MDDADRVTDMEAREMARFARKAALAPRPPGGGVARLVRCADCAERIPRARLRAVPHATRCAECQDDLEAAQRGVYG